MLPLSLPSSNDSLSSISEDTPLSPRKTSTGNSSPIKIPPISLSNSNTILQEPRVVLNKSDQEKIKSVRNASLSPSSHRTRRNSSASESENFKERRSLSPSRPYLPVHVNPLEQILDLLEKRFNELDEANKNNQIWLVIECGRKIDSLLSELQLQKNKKESESSPEKFSELPILNPHARELVKAHYKDGFKEREGYKEYIKCKESISEYIEQAKLKNNNSLLNTIEEFNLKIKTKDNEVEKRFLLKQKNICLEVLLELAAEEWKTILATSSNLSTQVYSKWKNEFTLIEAHVDHLDLMDPNLYSLFERWKRKFKIRNNLSRSAHHLKPDLSASLTCSKINTLFYALRSEILHAQEVQNIFYKKQIQNLGIKKNILQKNIKKERPPPRKLKNKRNSTSIIWRRSTDKPVLKDHSMPTSAPIKIDKKDTGFKLFTRAKSLDWKPEKQDLSHQDTKCEEITHLLNVIKENLHIPKAECVIDDLFKLIDIVFFDLHPYEKENLRELKITLSAKAEKKSEEASTIVLHKKKSPLCKIWDWLFNPPCYTANLQDFLASFHYICHHLSEEPALPSQILFENLTTTFPLLSPFQQKQALRLAIFWLKNPFQHPKNEAAFKKEKDLIFPLLEKLVECANETQTLALTPYIEKVIKEKNKFCLQDLTFPNPSRFKYPVETLIPSIIECKEKKEYTEYLKLFCISLKLTCLPTFMQITLEEWTEKSFSCENTPNIVALINYSTNLSLWTGWSLFSSSTTNLHSVIRILEFFIDSIIHLIDLHPYKSIQGFMDFTSASAIYNVLAKPCLSNAIAKVSSEHAERFSRIEQIFTFTGGQKSLRQILEKATGSPLIPPLALYLNDIRRISEANCLFSEIKTNEKTPIALNIQSFAVFSKICSLLPSCQKELATIHLDSKEQDFYHFGDAFSQLHQRFGDSEEKNNERIEDYIMENAKILFPSNKSQK